MCSVMVVIHLIFACKNDQIVSNVKVSLNTVFICLVETNTSEDNGEENKEQQISNDNEHNKNLSPETEKQLTDARASDDENKTIAEYSSTTQETQDGGTEEKVQFEYPDTVVKMQYSTNDKYQLEKYKEEVIV